MMPVGWNSRDDAGETEYTRDKSRGWQTKPAEAGWIWVPGNLF
jgi:hypothetical protein